MRNLLKFLIKYHFVVLFVLLEAVSIVMIVNYNNYQKVRFLNSGNAISGGIYSSYSSVGEYFKLRRINGELVKENTRLRSALQNEILFKVDNDLVESDSLLRKEYNFTSARVINNSVNRRYNYITLNKGSKHGIAPDMGVIANNCVIGIVINVSEDYCTVIPILNERSRISAKIKHNDYFGSLSWDGKDYRKVSLDEIPFHVSLGRTDTIVTSGYSAIFPEGLMLGTISDFRHEGGDNFYKISVELSTDFKKLVNVNIISNRKKKEILELESQSND
jgi:rod shape-determining protein MreC